ncbi:MAG: porphobilinogen synthase [Myxococcota bacterium]
MFEQPRRPRRLRSGPAVRALVRENTLMREDLVMPVFVTHEPGPARDVQSMPGVSQLSLEALPAEIDAILEAGIRQVLVFGLPSHKDPVGSDTWDDEHGIVQRAVRAIKDQWPELYVITDVCFCEYTDHGHCGVVDPSGRLLNDETLENLQRQTLSHARAGADMVAPSGMIDGMVGAMRAALDGGGFSDVAIMAYAVKYASAFYGPFREAADAAPQFGDRKTYQMDPANAREALREAALDAEQGADVLMVKPALSYLDVVRMLRDRFEHPIACYNVSGEYAMVKAAAARGWVDHNAIALEMLLSMKRAGADIIISYFARDLGKSLPTG